MNRNQEIKDLAEMVGGLAQFFTEAPSSNVRAICSSGSLALDAAIGIGGWPSGRLIELYGRESSGKTTVALGTIAAFQRDQEALPEEKRRYAALVEPECAFDPEYAKAVGVDLEKLISSQPDTLNACLNLIQKLAASGKVGLIVLDSLAATPTEQQAESEIGSANIASKARLLSAEIPKISHTLNNKNCTLLILNQVRDKPGIPFGNPEYTPGGNAVKFFCSVRVRIAPAGGGKGDERVKTKGKVEKNKVGVPYKTFEFEIEYGKGIRNGGFLLEMALSEGILIKKGSFYETKDKSKRLHGAEAAAGFCERNEAKILGARSAKKGKEAKSSDS